MAKYLYRTCPKCKDYLGVVVREPPRQTGEIPIDGRCLRSGFRLCCECDDNLSNRRE